MAKLQILAGDFGENRKADFVVTKKSCKIFLPKGGRGEGLLEVDFKQELERVEIHTEETVKKLAGTAGWGLAGAVLLGPVGLLAGLLLGGRKKQVLFAAYLKDGRKFLAVTDSKSFQAIQAAAF